jgi:subtilisin family serine protease
MQKGTTFRAGGRMTKYAVLRDPVRRAVADALDSTAQRNGRDVTFGPAWEVVPQVAVEDLDPRDLADLASDTDVVAAAREMPTCLVEPMPSACPEGAWGLDAIGATRSPWTGAGVLVALLDTGIDASHPAFRDVDLLEQDFTGQGNGDTSGHGTHCAGTILGRDTDGRRIGVATGVDRALMAKVLHDDGRGSSLMVFEAIAWAIAKGADVISLSLGLDFPGAVRDLVNDGWPADLATSNALEAYRSNLRMFDALAQTIRAYEPFNGGAVVVAASGNESRRDEHSAYRLAASIPAAADGFVSVGALKIGNDGYEVASFSNSFPVLAAPGVAIVSAQTGGGLVAKSGTSMACPHVAGCVALWWQSLRETDGRATSRLVTARLTATATTRRVANPDPSDIGVGMVTCP